MTSKRAGFSLLEMMTVMILISILGLIAMPSVRRAVYKAEARKVLTDMTAVRAAVLEYREDAGRLPGPGAWGTPPSELAPYLNNVDFEYKTLEYRVTTSPARGRVDFLVRYSADDPIGITLQSFARPGEESGTVTWTPSSTRFRMLEEAQ